MPALAYSVSLKSIEAIFGGRKSFTPSSLFAASEPGGWYDPSDLTTLYQDAAGTTPVTAVEQPVGLVLDKSRGLVLGSELVTNGTFDNSTTGWTANTGTMSVVASELYVNNNSDFCRVVQGIATAIGKTYRLTGTARFVRGSGVFLRATNDSTGGVTGVLANSASTTSSTNAALQCIFTATATTTYVALIAGQSGNVSEGYFDNISVRELPGSHLSQSTAAARPVLSARVNEFLHTEDFSNVYWTKGELNTTGTPAWVNVGTAPNGTTTADAIIPNTTNTYHGISRTGITVQNTTIRFSVRVKANGYNFIGLQFANAGTFGKYFEGVFNLTNGTVENTGRSVTYTGTRNTPVALGDGWYECSITVNSVDANSTSVAQVIVQSTNDPTAAFAGNGTSGVLIWGADLRPANAGVGLPAYQRVGAATYGVTNPSVVIGNPDYDTTGFPLYLKFDGTDDSLQSSTITPGSVDKAQVFAGVRKLAAAGSIGIVAEMGNSVLTAGTLNVASPGSVSGSTENFSFTVNGSQFAGYDAATYTAPITAVLSCSYDIGGSALADEVKPRINGTIPSTLNAGTNANAGTGTFTNQVLNVGSRNAGSALRFNGHLYSLILRFSAANLDAATITATETWVNGKTLAY